MIFIENIAATCRERLFYANYVFRSPEEIIQIKFLTISNNFVINVILFLDDGGYSIKHIFILNSQMPPSYLQQDLHT